jgi:hypothetical protein
MSRYKPGLHKKVSSIFDGVPLQAQNRGPDEVGTQLPPVKQDQAQTMHSQKQKTQMHEPVKKLYKDTAEKQIKTFAELDNSLKARCLRLYQSLKKRLLPSEPGVNPARQIASIILIPILFIVLIFVLVWVLGSNSAGRGRTTKVAASSSTTSGSRTINWRLPQPYSAQLRDPMKRGASASQWSAGSNAGSDAWLLNEGEVVLKGIVHGKDKASAIVGMQIVQEGDKIGDITVVKINRSSVEFERKGQQKILKVGQSWLLSD